LSFREKKTKQKNKLERYLRFKRNCNLIGCRHKRHDFFMLIMTNSYCLLRL